MSGPCGRQPPASSPHLRRGPAFGSALGAATRAHRVSGSPSRFRSYSRDVRSVIKPRAEAAEGPAWPVWTRPELEPSPCAHSQNHGLTRDSGPPMGQHQFGRSGRFWALDPCWSAMQGTSNSERRAAMTQPVEQVSFDSPDEVREGRELAAGAAQSRRRCPGRPADSAAGMALVAGRQTGGRHGLVHGASPVVPAVRSAACRHGGRDRARGRSGGRFPRCRPATTRGSSVTRRWWRLIGTAPRSGRGLTKSGRVQFSDSTSIRPAARGLR
jgi:hypothetical protein